MGAARGQRGSVTFSQQVHGSAQAAELVTLCEQATVTVDALGTFCPEPVIRTQNAARALGGGDVLLLLADDAGVEVDIPAWCLSTGHEYLGCLRDTDRIRVLVRIR